MQQHNNNNSSSIPLQRKKFKNADSLWNLKQQQKLLHNITSPRRRYEITAHTTQITTTTTTTKF